MVLAVVAAASSSGGAVDGGWQPSMQADKWDIRFSPGMPGHPEQHGEAWRFSFPRYDGALPCASLGCDSVGYVTTRADGPLRGELITLTIEITGSGFFQYQLEPENTCLALASVRLFFQRSRDDYEREFYRWWSNLNSILLIPGEHTIAVPLTPDRWSSVSGTSGNAASEEFFASLENAENIGMTFGGGCFFGHGVNVSGGDAMFTLKKFSITR